MSIDLDVLANGRWLIVCCLLVTTQAWAHEADNMFAGGSVRMDMGAGQDAGVNRWELESAAGDDNNKIGFSSEGEQLARRTEHAEHSVFLVHAIDDFWDLQFGLRRDTAPTDSSYGVIAVRGRAPYDIDMRLALFVSEHGDASARWAMGTDFHTTETSVLEPYVELNWQGASVPAQQLGVGLSRGDAGIRWRYRLAPGLSPYLDVRDSRWFGNSAAWRSRDERREDVSLALGLQWDF